MVEGLIITNEVINAISAKLYQTFKYPIYIDFKKNNIKFPCFYVMELDDASRSQDLDYRYLDTHQYDIRLFPNENDEITDIRTQINPIVEQLYMAMEYITASDGTVLRGTNMHHRTTDGVLHFFVDYKFFVLKPRDERISMRTLDINEGVKDGN